MSEVLIYVACIIMGAYMTATSIMWTVGAILSFTHRDKTISECKYEEDPEVIRLEAEINSYLRRDRDSE